MGLVIRWQGESHMFSRASRAPRCVERGLGDSMARVRDVWIRSAAQTQTNNDCEPNVWLVEINGPWMTAFRGVPEGRGNAATHICSRWKAADIYAACML